MEVKQKLEGVACTAEDTATFQDSYVPVHVIYLIVVVTRCNNENVNGPNQA